MQKEILTELRNLKDNTDFIINNNENIESRKRKNKYSK